MSGNFRILAKGPGHDHGEEEEHTMTKGRRTGYRCPKWRQIIKFYKLQNDLFFKPDDGLIVLISKKHWNLAFVDMGMGMDMT